MFFLLIIFLCCLRINVVLADSNVADQRFIDNSDQFSEESGVRIYSDGQEDSSDNYEYRVDEELNKNPLDTEVYYDDPNLIPVAVKNGKKKVQKKQPPSMGFSFSQMAKISQKKDERPKPQQKPESVKKKSKSFGFSFSDMASLSQKKPTENVRKK